MSYTHVFPIEFEAAGGVQTLKIGYNDGDNPFVVAQAFIDKYELPQYHLQQIADYIVSRVGQTPVQLGSDVSLSQHSQVTFPLAKEYKNLPQKYCITFNTDLPHPEKVMDKIKTLNTEIEVCSFLTINFMFLFNTNGSFDSDKVSSGETISRRH